MYQITKELNTFKTIGTGKSKKKVYDYPELNGGLDTLRTLLKEYSRESHDKYDLYDGGFVIGFLLPTLIIYWCSKIKTKNESEQKDERRKGNANEKI